jgi:hypothetical protein
MISTFSVPLVVLGSCFVEGANLAVSGVSCIRFWNLQVLYGDDGSTTFEN